MASHKARKRPPSTAKAGARPPHTAEPARLAALRDYLAFQRGEPLREEPPGHLRAEPDRRLYVQLLRGMVRHRRLLEAELERLARRPLGRLDPAVAAAALLGLFQLYFLERVPAHAAVFETVGLAGALKQNRARGLINGVLRASLREGAESRAALAMLPLAVRTSHPDWMVARWTARYGEAAAAAICEANNSGGGLTVRVEAGRISREELLERLAAEGVTAEAHPLLPGAILVGQAGALLTGRAFAEGLCYVQDVSSQLLLAWAAPLLTGRVMDVCAAPGGKLSHLAGLRRYDFRRHDFRRHDLRVLGADISPRRLARVRENFVRLGLPPPPLIAADGCRLPLPGGSEPGGWPDGLLLDVPCSATGIIRRHPELKWRKLPEHLPGHVETQRALLAEAARVLKPGGLLLYATCSIEPEENEENVAWFLTAHPEFRRRPFSEIPPPAGLGEPPGGLLTADGDLLILPGPERTGMYGALLQKSSKE